MGKGFTRFAALFVTLGVAIGCTKKETEPVYSMGLTPSENALTIQSNGDFMAQVVSKNSGVKLKAYVATDYTGLIEAMRGGQVQFGWLPPFALVLAEKHAGAKVLSKCIRFGKAYFYSAVIVRSDSPYKKLSDLKGKTIAWVDPASSSGYIVPKASMINDGIDPDKFFRKQIFAGGHDTVVLGVINGSVDAGAVFTNEPDAQTGAWTMLSSSRPEYKKMLRAIYVSQPIPNDTFATTEKFYKEHKDVVDKVNAAVLKLGDSPEGKKALDELYKIDSMAPAKSEEFESLRKAADKLKVDLNGKAAK